MVPGGPATEGKALGFMREVRRMVRNWELEQLLPELGWAGDLRLRDSVAP